MTAQVRRPVALTVSGVFLITLPGCSGSGSGTDGAVTVAQGRVTAKGLSNATQHYGLLGITATAHFWFLILSRLMIGAAPPERVPPRAAICDSTTHRRVTLSRVRTADPRTWVTAD